MKKLVARLTTVALLIGLALTITPMSHAQAAAAAGKAEKFQALAKQLNLTPQQEKELIPILQANAPKLEAIKNNTSLGPMQKLEQMKAVHAQSDPQVKAILNPQQYEQLQQIRQQEIHQAMEKKMDQQ